MNHLPGQVTVVVPTFYRRRSLVRCLRALPVDVEVVVVDDGSTDRSREAVERLALPTLRYVRQDNGGPASARNLGVREASTDYIAFIDDDCVPAGNWPWPLWERLIESSLTVAGVGGRVLPLRSGLFADYYTCHRTLEPPPSCAYLVTANCLYRREALEEVGGFDETITHAGGEDPALSAKIRAVGYGLLFEPTGVVWHEYRESLMDFVKTFYRYGKGCAHVVGQ